MLNNDVENPQHDFIPQIGAHLRAAPVRPAGAGYRVGVLRHPPEPEKRGRTLENSKNPILLLLSSGEKNSPAIWRLVQIRNRKKQHIDTTRPAESVVLHGSCVIFSQRYLARHPEPFYPKTFMYYEMEILDWLCRQDGSVVRYDPSISVLHYQYVASKMEYRSIVRRSKFVIDCLLDSLDAAEELILASETSEPEGGTAGKHRRARGRLSAQKGGTAP